MKEKFYVLYQGGLCVGEKIAGDERKDFLLAFYLDGFLDSEKIAYIKPTHYAKSKIQLWEKIASSDLDEIEKANSFNRIFRA